MAYDHAGTERRRKPPIGRLQRQNAYLRLVEEHWRAMIAAVLDEDYSRYCAERLRWRAAEAMLCELVSAEWSGPELAFTRDMAEVLEASEALDRRQAWPVLRGRAEHSAATDPSWAQHPSSAVFP